MDQTLELYVLAFGEIGSVHVALRDAALVIYDPMNRVHCGRRQPIGRLMASIIRPGKNRSSASLAEFAMSGVANFLRDRHAFRPGPPVARRREISRKQTIGPGEIVADSLGG